MTDTFDNRLTRVPIYTSSPEDVPGPEPMVIPPQLMPTEAPPQEPWYSRAGNALLGVLDQFGVAGLPEGERREATREARNKLLHIGPMEEQDYLWPEKMLRSAVTLAGDVRTGNVPPPGLRREDYTDIPADPSKVGGTPHDDLIQRVQDMAGLAMTGGLAGTGAGGKVLGSGLTRPSAVRKGNETHVKFSELPPDMQVLIEDFVHGNGNSNKVIPEELPLVGVKTENLPKMEMDTFDRGEGYARRIDLEGAPPTIVANGHFMDGRHRAFKAREEGVPELNAIDLSGLIDERMQRNNTHGRILKSDNTSAAPLAALEKRAPVWYSPVEQALENSTQARATGAQWLATLRNSRGVKPEELDWTGLRQYLEERADKPVSRPELHEYLRDNRVELQDVTKGAGQPTWDQLTARQRKDVQEHYEEYSGGNPGDPERFVRQWYEQLEPADAATIFSGTEPMTKYHDYQLPGGENYREHLLTMPGGRPQKLDVKVKQVEGGWQTYVNGKASGRISNSNLTEEQALAVATQAANDLARNLSSPFRSSHWDEPNIVAHVRSNVREMPEPGGFVLRNRNSGNTTRAFKTEQEAADHLLTLPEKLHGSLDIVPSDKPIKKRSLHLEEVQSDWHQAGRRKGYQQPVKNPRPEFDQVQKELNAIDAQHPYNGDVPFNEYMRSLPPELAARYRELASRLAELQEAVNRFGRNAPDMRVPDAPWKKTWHELALRRMIRLAAEEGMDRISWTPGEAQAARYDLSKSIDRVLWSPEGEKFMAFDKNGRTLIEKQVKKEELPDVIGKEAADKLVNKPTRIDDLGRAKMHSLENADLKIGGEGMKGFYDKMMVQAAEKLGREYGVKVRRGSIPGKEVNKTVDDRYSVTGDKKIYDTRAEAEKAAAQPIWYFDIPPAMREAALGRGMPLFSGGKMFVPSGAQRGSEER